MKFIMSFKFFFFLLIIDIVKIFCEECKSGEVKCSSGVCAPNYKLCATFTSCQDNLFKCNQFTCTSQNYKCIPNSCKDKSCWNGYCVKNYDECPSIPTCPLNDKNYLIKCHDNSCEESLNNCNDYIECPLFIPIKCTSGDCRRRQRDCPSLIRCPNKFPILCNDGSCQETSDECITASQQTQCADNSWARCSDGSCVPSKFLCQTPKTCPLEFVLCWDGSCASSYSKCEVPSVQQKSSCKIPDANLIRCLDGSCRDTISNCPTMMVCPIDSPVRCWDNSCKESITKCPDWQECPKDTISCSDGTCIIKQASTTKVCGTLITCSETSPFKCFDNTCRKNPLDCPPIDVCPGIRPILCWNGKCVNDRMDCIPPDTCDNNNPVKCPDGTCQSTREDCVEINGCPIGFVKCNNGVCKMELKDCLSNICPSWLSFQCNNGMCVSAKKYCDNDNGCAWYKSFKCKNGECVKDVSFCKNNNTFYAKEGYKYCEDGSQVKIGDKCSLENGCPIDFPKLCADNTCISKELNCTIPICPDYFPIKCINGFCASTISNCQSNNKYENFCINEVLDGGNFYPCADGRCAESPEGCKPTFPCPIGFVKCSNGMCKTDKDNCPNTEKTDCPSELPIRCEKMGECAKSFEKCIISLGCPVQSGIKCSNNGICSNSLSLCDTYDNNLYNDNGCPKDKKYKCFPTGECVRDDPEINPDVCKNKICKDLKPVFCYNNGQCAENARKCSELGNQCDNGLVRCPDRQCKQNYMDCINKDNCPMTNPFRCVNGDCKRYPNLYVFGLYNNFTEACPQNIQCPSYKPYLCADGSCKHQRNFCQSFLPCPVDKPYRCPNRLCYKSQRECPGNCNSMNPILCPNGNCVSSIFDCEDNECPSFLPILCSDGNCVLKPNECNYFYKIPESNLYINTFNKTSNCRDSEALCYDGSCRPDITMCPIYQGCIDSLYPIKCRDATCKKSIEECLPLISPCNESEELCEDGMCRKKNNCPNYNGCPNSANLMCPNGYCVKYLYECAAKSAQCPIYFPFRCIDGSCKADITECKSAKRLNLLLTIGLFVYEGVTFESDIIKDTNNNILGTIYIPANLFNNTIETINRFIISTVPSSLLRDTYFKFNFTRKDDIFNIFNYADINLTNTFDYEHSVLSPTINITLMNKNISFNSNLSLSLTFDFLPGINNNSKFKPESDVCMGKLNFTSKQWTCLENSPIISDKIDYWLESDIIEPGLYAVIFNPTANNEFLDKEENFFIKYFVLIVIFIGVLTLVMSIGVYVFMRIYRYREKYKNTVQEEIKFNIQMKNITEIGSMSLGQNLGDLQDHLFYTKNPSFKVEKLQTRIGAREIELENLHELLSRKLRILEGNNDHLKSNFNLMIGEIDRLKKYYKTYINIYIVFKKNS